MNINALPHYIKLTRIDRPIGTYLLLWPTLTALWLASDGVPDIKNLIIFTLGVFLMRSAGCVINDYADRKFDGYVKRTVARPLANGLVSEREALMLFGLLIGISFILVLLTNWATIQMSVFAVMLAATYPFMKRYTYLPQVVLGAAFSWGIPMTYTAVGTPLSHITWLLFCANIIWTVMYDTQYAMVDRDDDLKIGIRSTAILFGDADKVILAILQLMTLLAWAMIGHQAELGWFWWLGLTIAAVLFGYQQWLVRHRNRDLCFKAFLNNHWIGLAIFIGLVLDKLFLFDSGSAFGSRFLGIY